MEYVYAALMLHKLKKEITEENVTSIIKASGAEVNEAQVKSLVASLADVNIEDAIKAAPVAAVAAAPAAAGAGDGGEAEEKDSFDVHLADAGDKKIQVIKEVRTLTNLGLKDAKDLVDGAPNTIMEGASKEDAEKAKEALEAAGATIELK